MTDHRHLLDTHPNLKEFAPFLDDLNKESERGAVLISVSYLERQLKEIVSAFLWRGRRIRAPSRRIQRSSGHARGTHRRSRRSRPHIRTRVPGTGNDQKATQPIRPRSSHRLLGSGYRRSLPEPCLLGEGLRRCHGGFPRPIHHGRAGANSESDEPLELCFQEAPDIRELAFLARGPVRHRCPERRWPNAREAPCHERK